MVGTITLRKTWQHGRSLLAGIGTTILATVSVGCAASAGNTSSENKTSPESQSISTAQKTLDDVADKTLNLSQQSAAAEPQSITQSDQSSEQGDVPEFTTEGKPTKTIETPWGPREVYDPTQDVEIKSIFKKWYEENQYSAKEYKEHNQADYEIINTAREINRLDMKRLGCLDVDTNDGESVAVATKHGRNNTFDYFKGSCGVDHNFGSLNLTQCEKSKQLHIKTKIKPGTIFGAGVGVRDFNTPGGNPISPRYAESKRRWFSPAWTYRVIGSKGLSAFDQTLDRIMLRKCFLWREVKPKTNIGFTIIDGGKLHHRHFEYEIETE